MYRCFRAPETLYTKVRSKGFARSVCVGPVSCVSHNATCLSASTAPTPRPPHNPSLFPAHDRRGWVEVVLANHPHHTHTFMYAHKMITRKFELTNKRCTKTTPCHSQLSPTLSESSVTCDLVRMSLTYSEKK